jgi:predicted DNA-binding protein (UPF0251 family)
MSPRPFRLRKISNPPSISGFKPYGNKKKSGKDENVFLHLEEYEALRLCDFEMLNHHQASVLMAVSRPTLTRIYSKARQKIAEAFVQGKTIIIEGGKIYFDSEWYSCRSCGCFFNNPDKQEEINECPLCSSTNFYNYEPNEEEPVESISRCTDICTCLSCGFEKPHSFGCPCRYEICPVCGKNLVRKGTLHINSY